MKWLFLGFSLLFLITTPCRAQCLDQVILTLSENGARLHEEYQRSIEAYTSAKLREGSRGRLRQSVAQIYSKLESETDDLYHPERCKSAACKANAYKNRALKILELEDQLDQILIEFVANSEAKELLSQCSRIESEAKDFGVNLVQPVECP
jgi:hypothetical protein